MSEENKQICRRLLEEAWNRGVLETVDKTVSLDCSFHDPAFPSFQTGAESYKRLIQMCRDAFPNLSYTVDEMIAERNEVVIHWTARGTYRGQLLGTGACDRSITIPGTSIHRLAGGKIVELWADWSHESLRDQLGLGMTQADANKALAQRFVEEIWNQKKPEMISEFVTDDYTRLSPNEILRGAEALRQVYDTYISAFPDIHVQVEDIVCTGDRVVLRMTASGTHTGRLMNVAASWKPVRVQGTTILRIVAGKVAEEHMVWDTLGLLQQIGVVPGFVGLRPPSPGWLSAHFGRP